MRVTSSTHFYPRSPCGERRPANWFDLWGWAISIHALLAESDQLYDTYAKVLRVFLSTLSLRRATLSGSTKPRAHRISIHALLAESDDMSGATGRILRISIHALLAESDTMQVVIIIMHALFLSTLSLRRATYLVRGQRPNWRISIHALLAESDDDFEPSTTRRLTFLSTLSLRRATWLIPRDRKRHPDFYPRSPCGERPIRL